MEYLLVLQLPITTLADFDRMIELEELIRADLGNLAEVDGHDAGSGEGNIFIFTDNPSDVFARIRAMAEMAQVLPLLKAAYREVEQATFVILHPIGLNHFSII